jgi:Holliday junction resolvase RusA-like endonuclease
MNPNIQNAKKQEFMEALQWEMVVQGVKVFRSPVDLLIEVYFPVYRGRDKDNYLKWTKDALKGFAVVDDSPKYIPNEDVQFPKGKHHMEIILTPIKDGD